MLNKDHGIFPADAWAYSWIETPTDHRLVKARLPFKWYKLKPQKNAKTVCIETLRNAGQRIRYQEREGTVKLVNNNPTQEGTLKLVNNKPAKKAIEVCE